MNKESITVRVIDALNAESVPNMLVGSFSSNYYGIPRSTEDADFVLQVEGTRLDALLRRLSPDFVADPQVTFETNTGTCKHLLKFSGTSFKVELFLLSSDPHDQERWRRRLVVAAYGRQVSLPSPEDVVITKLRWSRGKDREDVQAVIAVQQSTLDWPYVEKWCDQHGTRTVLDEIRKSVPAV